MDLQKCQIHGVQSISHCNWCSAPICEQCLVVSRGKKYCPRCFDKMNKEVTPLMGYVKKIKNPEWGEAPTRKILNYDPDLSEEDVAIIRKRLKIDGKKKKGFHPLRE